MRLKNAELVRGKIKRGSPTTFSGFWYDAGTTINGEVVLNSDVIRLTSTNISCRDQLIPAIHQALNDYLKDRLPSAKLRSDGSDLAFEFDIKDKVARQLTMAIMGTTNRRYTPLASPFTLRWVWGHVRAISSSMTVYKNLQKADDTVESIRKAIRTDTRMTPHTINDWFFQLMVKADEQGIELNPQVREAWALSATPQYAMLGLMNLYNKNKTAFGNGPNSKFIWDQVFPPSRLV